VPSFAVAEHTMGVPWEFTPVAPVVVHHVPVVTTCGGSAAAVADAELGGDVVADGFDATVVVAPGTVVVVASLDVLVVLDGFVVEVWGLLVVVCGVFTDVSSLLMLNAATAPPAMSNARIAPMINQRRLPRGAPCRLAWRSDRVSGRPGSPP
jgi:hypothetical protein